MRFRILPFLFVMFLLLAAICSFAVLVEAQTFVKYDTATLGNWKGVYGSSGASVALSQPTLPSSVLSFTNASTWTWAGSTTDTRALTTTSGPRIASCWYNTSFQATVNFTGNVAFYIADWDSQVRTETIQAGNDVRVVTNFVGGEYVVYNVSGPTVFTFSANSGPNAVVLGVFLDPSSSVAPPPVVTPPTCPAIQHIAVLAWSAVSGATGYTVSRSTTSGGPYTLLSGPVLLVPNPSFTDNTVQAGTTYYYVTSSQNSTGSSGYSAQIPVTVPSP